MGSLFGSRRGEVCRSEDVVLEESSHMYGCALELNMNSFIRAKQKGRPNPGTSSRVHTQSHTLLFVSSPSNFDGNITLKDFLEECFFIPREMCVHCLLYCFTLAGVVRLNPTKLLTLMILLTLQQAGHL